MNKDNGMTEKFGRYRWIIVSLLLFSTTINYMDRNVIGFLKDYFCSAQGFGWTPQDFSYLTSVFTLFYALFTIFAGAIIDKIGTRLGLMFSLIIWSFAGIMSAFVGKTIVAQGIIRSIFGAGEAGNFPASVKTVAEWFPKKERALATGIFNSGSNIGAMICALFVPWALLLWGKGHEFLGIFAGWQMAFILTGIIGLIWLVFWLVFYGTPKEMLAKGKVTQTEYDYIHSDKDEAVINASDEEVVKKISWGKMLAYRQTWAFLVGKFMTDGIWWFLLFWLPTYVKQQFCVGLSPDQTADYVMISNFIVFGIAIVGSIYGGAIPLSFMNKGWSTYKARMTAMLLIACAPLALLATQPLANSYGIVAAIAMVCIGGAAHQAWSANLFTTVSDMFPKKAVGTITGIGTTAGGVGGVLVQLLAGHLDGTLKASVAYGIMFAVCAFAYLIAWALIKMLVPKFKIITDL
ncbi:MFS transporter [Microbacter margulisiae]|uniref:ACS family hexuronate transporter-like MFS transporter n=1 Tax=Microbacter margulisiae TaxID=1350067 RepID=A0A7W5H1P4_9PORP|nr:MFS transporter [Microbacter margulisiae]MBB3186829.1 ACS family hexuronate transporter-like MFS transporter [Microbacter margulisiae]